MTNNKFGVSPAFLLSAYGNDFLPEQVAEAAERIKKLGFDAFQCEIVKEDKLLLWEQGGAQQVEAAARNTGLEISQFVAHLMIEYSGSKEVLCSRAGLDEIKRVLDICSMLQFKGQVTVPIGPFENDEKLTEAERLYYTEKLIEKFRTIYEIAEKAGNHMAVEVQPHSLLGGVHGIIAFINAVAPDVGYNFDTGHAWASGSKNIADFPYFFKDKLFGTHLCDNNSITNDSLCPGEGTIDWKTVISNLVHSGYTGSLDLEIFTAPDLVEKKYLKGKRFLQSFLV